MRAIRNGERIVVHGDYDVDGMCSTTVLLRTIRALGGDAVPFIPRRIEDGYDLTLAGVNAAIAANAKVARHLRLRHERARAGAGGMPAPASTSSSPIITCRAARCRRASPC